MVRATITAPTTFYNLVLSSDPINLTFYNPNSLYVRVELRTGSTVLATQDFGQVSGAQDFTIGNTVRDAIYALIPNSTVLDIVFRVKTYTDPAYTTQFETNLDYAGSFKIDESINK